MEKKPPFDLRESTDWAMEAVPKATRTNVPGTKSIKRAVLTWKSLPSTSARNSLAKLLLNLQLQPFCLDPILSSFSHFL